jgi:hypothetical protein
MVRIVREKIFDPPNPRIFVFGSNLAGRHGKGAALHAAKYYGAERSVAIGHINQCYAIPTMDQMLRPLHLTQVKHFISGFVAYANHHPNLKFNVTQVGCGLAGFDPRDIAPCFNNAPNNCWFDKEWERYFTKPKQYWEAPI